MNARRLANRLAKRLARWRTRNVRKKRKLIRNSGGGSIMLPSFFIACFIQEMEAHKVIPVGKEIKKLCYGSYFNGKQTRSERGSSIYGAFNRILRALCGA